MEQKTRDLAALSGAVDALRAELSLLRSLISGTSQKVTLQDTATDLMRAVVAGDAERVEKLAKDEEGLRRRNAKGQTALDLAGLAGRMDIAGLLSNGQSPQTRRASPR